MAEIENPIEDMEVEAGGGPEEKAGNGNGGTKREREDEGGEETESKKVKGDAAAADDDDKSFEEERLVKSSEEEGEEEEVKEVKLGPKVFANSVEMFDYFNKLLRVWNIDYDLNKYEQLVLTDLIKKGHAEAERKIGPGISAFEVKFHPKWKSRCFFVRRADGSSEDFSFRKCVDNILPLPEDLKIGGKNGGNNGGKRGGRGRGGWGRGGRGRGRRD